MYVAPPHHSTNFANLIWRAARAWPDSTVIDDDGRLTTFSGLRDLSAGLAHILGASGVRQGDAVCILASRGATAAASFFGTLAAGGIACLVNEAYRPRQVRYVVEHTGARVVVAPDHLWSEVRDMMPPGVVWVDPHTAGVGSEAPAEVGGRSPAQIIYTSGSTGRPKGVVSSHANLWAGAEIVAGYLGLQGQDRIASLLPFSFVYGFSQLACALVTGATLVIERATLPVDIVEGLRRSRVTVLAGVPPIWMQLLRVLEQSPLEALRVATCAGGRLAPELVRRLRACQPGTSLFLMYGLTEVFRSTSLAPEEVDAHPDSMGRAVPGSEVLVLDDSGRECGPGEIGELVHRGPTVALGYWRDPDGTSRVFRCLPDSAPNGEPAVFSGDLVRRDEAGRLYYVGRRDRMIKTLGYRVSPEEVNDVLIASGLLKEAAVTAEPDAQRGQRIVAHVCLREGVPLAELKRVCGAELPRYMQPARYVLHEALPRNAVGKIDLVALDGV